MSELVSKRQGKRDNKRLTNITYHFSSQLGSEVWQAECCSSEQLQGREYDVLSLQRERKHFTCKGMNVGVSMISIHCAHHECIEKH